MKVNKPNMAQKGTVTVEKTGEVFSGVNVSGSEDSDVIYQPVYEVAGLEGAVYEVRAAEDISTPDGTLRYSKGEVVDTITTSSDGFVKSKELYLGKYEVKEITAPYGMVISGESTSLSAQTGHTVPFTRALITDFHSLPHLLHLHQTFFLDFAFTSSGFNGKFFSDHSEAISGCVVCKSLNPFRNMYPLQYGHLLPPERVEIRVFHSLPQSLHFHQALRLAKTVT